MPVAPRLTICIATLNRARFIGETLDSIVPQLRPGVELLVVDGASTDNTEQVVARYVALSELVQYVRLTAASGVDQDYDTAVSLARGEYCWLFTDDDLIVPGAVDRVLAAIADGVELVVLNSEVRTVDFRGLVSAGLLAGGGDAVYAAGEGDRLLADAGNSLSFIGCVVISRSFWLGRDRRSYYGSLFVHVGVIFGGPTPSARLVAAPQIVIRYGNAMWTPRGFEIWMFKWPGLVWSFEAISDQAKWRICAPEPWRKPAKLWLYRSIGGYDIGQYRRLLAAHPMPTWRRLMAQAVARVPSRVANAVASLYCLLRAREARMNIYDLAKSPHRSLAARAVARLLGVS